MLRSKFAHSLLQLLEGTDLDLADAFPTDIVDLAEIFERLRLILQLALSQDMALTLVQLLHRLHHHGAAVVQLVLLGIGLGLIGIVVGQPILPFGRALTIGFQRCVQ